MPVFLRYLLAGLFLAPTLAFGQDDAALYRDRVVRQGVAVELVMQRVEPQEAARPLQQGDDVIFQFNITDTASEAPLTSVYPAAWMDLRPEGEPTNEDICTRKAQHFIGGSLFSQAELDLNVYYVLALNDDATVTVVDPLFGFGSTKLLAMIALPAPGFDWALTDDQARLLVSVPGTGQVAYVTTASWTLSALLDVGPRPARLRLQPDEHYAWVSYGDAETGGVAVLRTDRPEVAARIPAGAGPHDLAFSPDSRYAYLTSAAAGTVTVIDIRTLEAVAEVATGRFPVSVDYSPVAGTAYVAHRDDGTVVAIDGTRHTATARLTMEPGLHQLRFAPDGRHAFVLDPAHDIVYILDAATQRIIQRGHLLGGPDHVSFSDELAYIRHRDSEIVLMVALDEVGVEGRPIQVVDFPGGQHPPGSRTLPTPADGIVQAPGANAVLIANADDRAIYYYKEGMAAPMGSFRNYSRQPRAVQVVDRSLRARARPGVYETVAQLRRPGLYDVIFFMDAPRIVHCFTVEIAPDPEAPPELSTEALVIEPLIGHQRVRVGEAVQLPFRLRDPESGTPRTDLTDVQILTYQAPGVWHRRTWAAHQGEGVYSIDFAPPQAGIYYVHVESRAEGQSYNNPRYLIIEAVPPQ